jgi:hypothetical protein
MRHVDTPNDDDSEKPLRVFISTIRVAKAYDQFLTSFWTKACYDLRSTLYFLITSGIENMVRQKARLDPISSFVLSKGLQRVRDYGFMHGNARRLRLAILLLLAPQWIGPMPTSLPVHSKAVRTCPCCEHEMVCVGITRPS